LNASSPAAMPRAAAYSMSASVRSKKMVACDSHPCAHLSLDIAL
jgi:hypothetical protein